MADTIIPWVNQEFKKNIQSHKEEAKPFIDYMQKVVDTKYQQEEAVKVRGDEINSLTQRYRHKTGDETPIYVPDGIRDIPMFFEGITAAWKRLQAPEKNITDLTNKAQKEFSDGYKKIGAREDGEDADLWFGEVKSEDAKIKAEQKKTDKVTVRKGTFYNRETQEKVTIMDIDTKTQTGKTLAGVDVNMSDYTETAPIKPQTDKVITKYEDDIVEMGIHEYIQSLFPNADEETYKTIVSRINRLDLRAGKLGKRDIAVKPAEQVRAALALVGNRTLDEINKELKAEQKKKGGRLFGGGKGKYNKTLVAELKTQKNDRRMLDKIFKGIEKKVIEEKVKKEVNILEQIKTQLDITITQIQWDSMSAEQQKKIREKLGE